MAVISGGYMNGGILGDMGFEPQAYGSLSPKEKIGFYLKFSGNLPVSEVTLMDASGYFKIPMREIQRIVQELKKEGMLEITLVKGNCSLTPKGNAHFGQEKFTKLFGQRSCLEQDLDTPQEEGHFGGGLHVTE